MSGNAWVGQHAGKEDSRITRISPYLFGAHGVRNILYLPKLRDLPASGLDFKAIVFDFGFNKGTPILLKNGTQKSMIAADRALLIWGIVAYTAAEYIPGYAFYYQLLHSHEGNQRNFFSKHVSASELAGPAGLAPQIAGVANSPVILRMPYMVLKGDQLTCEIRNPAPSNQAVQVVLYGGEFD